MITIKNICTTFSTLENECRFFFFFSFWLTVSAMKTNRGTEKWVRCVDEVEKEMHMDGTKQQVMYQKK